MESMRVVFVAHVSILAAIVQTVLKQVRGMSDSFRQGVYQDPCWNTLILGLRGRQSGSYVYIYTIIYIYIYKYILYINYT